MAEDDIYARVSYNYSYISETNEYHFSSGYFDISWKDRYISLMDIQCRVLESTGRPFDELNDFNFVVQTHVVLRKETKNGE